MVPSRLEQVAKQHRAALIRRDAEALSEMARAYAPAHRAIRAQLAEIQAKIAAAHAEGRTLGRAWLFQEHRAEQLDQQIRSSIAGFSPRATDIAVKAQTRNVAVGKADAKTLAGVASGRAAPAVLTSWVGLPDHALEDLVGFAGNGSPLRELFDKLGPQVSQSVRDELASGLALGRNPVVVARRVVERSGMGLARALTISRTESLRSYRESTRRSYDASPVVQGWLWLSARDVTTCAACWGMDGTKSDTGELMEAHPNCRCTMVPDTGSQLDIGNGPDVFDTLSETDQRQVLGPGKHDAFKEGKIGLKDLVAKRHDPDWGTSVQVSSLSQALGG